MNPFKPFRFSLACNGETHYFEEGIDWNNLEFIAAVDKLYWGRHIKIALPTKFVNWKRRGILCQRFYKQRLSRAGHRSSDDSANTAMGL